MTILLVNDRSRDYGKTSLEHTRYKKKGISLNTIVSKITTTDVIKFMDSVAKVDWSEAKKNLEKGEWKDLGLNTIENTLKALKPWLPQADAAAGVIDMAQRLVDKVPDKPHEDKPVDIKKVVQGAEVLMKVDWEEFIGALQSDSPTLASLVTAKDLAQLAVPFVPQAIYAEKMIGSAVAVLEFFHPIKRSEPEKTTTGQWDWDPFLGWVPAKNKTSAPSPYIWDPIWGWVKK